MRGLVIILFIILIALVGGWLVYSLNKTGPTTSTVTPSSTTSSSGATTTAPIFDQSLSDGTITISYPSADFGLATNQTQILTHTNVPPCGTPFNYCLYYTGSAYRGTNFESAGIRIARRAALNTQTKCLTTQPAGYTGLIPKTASSTDYATSIFAPLGNSAAGHLVAGALYRLDYANTCYEFEVRLAETDFGNYPSGSIQQFTTDQETALAFELQQILGTLTLPSGEVVTFPQP